MMTRNISCVYRVMMLGLCLVGSAQAASFENGWRFSLGDFAAAMMPGFDHSDWREVQIPHDWSVEGPFGPQYGSGNGDAPGGIGWYRKSFDLKAEDQGKRVVVMFDGVGQRVATDDSKIRFDMTGPGRILGIGNGNLNDVQSNQDLTHSVYEGRGLAIVQSGVDPGTIRIQASSDGLESAHIELVVK